MRGTVLVVDGNSLLHRNYHALAGTNMRAPSGEPSWALYGMWNQLSQIANRVGATHVTVAFDSTATFRAADYPEYKAGRSTKPDDLVAQLRSAPIHFANAGIHVVTCDGFEADDVVASAAARNSHFGFDTVIATSDRDAFSLIASNENGTSVSVLRVINGGIDASPLLTTKRLPILCGVTPDQYRLYAALRGDKSDNLPGVVGIGEKTAVALLSTLRERGETLDELLADLDAGGDRLASIIGKGAANKFANPTSRENLERNLTMMKQVDTLNVGNVDDAALPLPGDQLKEELASWRMARVATQVMEAFAWTGNVSVAEPTQKISTNVVPQLELATLF